MNNNIFHQVSSNQNININTDDLIDYLYDLLTNDGKMILVQNQQLQEQNKKLQIQNQQLQQQNQELKLKLETKKNKMKSMKEKMKLMNTIDSENNKNENNEITKPYCGNIHNIIILTHIFSISFLYIRSTIHGSVDTCKASSKVHHFTA